MHLGYYRKGDSLMQLGQYEDAIFALSKALEIEPNNADVKRALDESKFLLKHNKFIHGNYSKNDI